MEHITYFRVSTLQQGASGLGLAAQKELVMRFLGNTQPIAEFVEVESGKRHKNRPQLLAALELCKRKKAKLVIAKLDRLSRNVAFISSLMESGVDFVCCDNPHANRLMLHMLAAFAEHEREMISDRVRAALARVKAELLDRGPRVSQSGRVYSKLGGPKLADARRKAAELRKAMRPPEHTLLYIGDLRATGKSLRQIAAHLNERNLRTSQGFRWYASTVRAALLSCLPATLTAATPSIAGFSAGRKPAQEGGMPMPSEIREAERMFDLFTSVGARSFVVTKTDIEGKLIWGKTYSAVELRDKLPAMVRTATTRKPHTLPSDETVMVGENLIIRPTGGETVFAQLDDLSTEQLERVRSAAFLIHATSPDNHQAWIAVSDVDKATSKDFIRRVRKAVGDADMSASGATRLAGTLNFKSKYGPDYPTVQIVYGVPGRIMTPEQLQSMGLLTEKELMKAHVSPARASSTAHDRPWPSYEITLSRTRPKKDGSGPDRSLADFSWAMISITGSKEIEDTIAKLLEVSQNAQERAARGDEGYARITVENAAAAVARNWGRNRS